MQITEVLSKLRIPYRVPGTHTHARAGWVQIDCPYCSPRSDRFRMGINLDKGYCNCWMCGGRRLIAVLGELTRLSGAECKSIISQVRWKHTKQDQTEATNRRLQVPAGVGPLLGAHRRYLRGRGFDPDEVQRLWQVQGIGLAAKLGWRLFIPIVQFGETVSWTTRSIGSGSARYLSASPEQELISMKRVLYGEDYARHSIVVCEGPIDVWAIGPGAVGTLGVSYTRDQVTRIGQYLVRVICFDSEPAAQRRARRLATELTVFAGETHVVELETGGDAAEASRSEIADLRARWLD